MEHWRAAARDAMNLHGIIPEYDSRSNCGCRRGSGSAAWSHQHDARRIAKPIAETDAAAGAAAICRDHYHHDGGLGDGTLISNCSTVKAGIKTMVVLNRIYTRTGDDGTTAL